MARKMLIDGELEKHSEEETRYDFDLFVIGAGSGGVRASRFSAQYGAKVGICELPFHPISTEVIGGVGGTCVIRGCVPKKILVYGATFGSELEDARSYGWELNEKIDFNWKKLLHKKTEEIVRLNGIYKRLLSNAGVKLFEGEGKVVGPNEVEVIQLDGTKISYSAKHILIATGSRAQRPSIPGQELAITSDEALSLEELPKRAVILGGGYIAVEFASIWRGMGATVDLCFRKELPLRGFDDEMRAVVARTLEGRGITMHPRTTLTELVKTEDGIKVRTDHGEELLADVVLFATGRAPNTKRLNLEAVGVELDKTGAVKVDEYSRTNLPSIWAIGDVTNRMNLTPVALMEGTCFAKTVFGGQPSKPDYSNVPCAVFCIPPLSVVGLSEEQAIEQANGDVLAFTSTFNPMKNTISGRQEKTVMKLVVDGETDKVLGASMCGPDAAEIMQGIAVALKCGATKAQFDSTSFSLDIRNGKKCYVLGARKLLLSWGGCWSWTQHPQSRFSEVAKLKCPGSIHIRGKIKTQMLSSNTAYAAYLVFHLAERLNGLESSRTVIRFVDPQIGNSMIVTVEGTEKPESEGTGKIAQMRRDGWMEIEMGNFYNGEDDNREVEAWLIEINNPVGKSGFIVEGIEFRPV